MQTSVENSSTTLSQSSFLYPVGTSFLVIYVFPQKSNLNLFDRWDFWLRRLYLAFQRIAWSIVFLKQSAGISLPVSGSVYTKVNEGEIMNEWRTDYEFYVILKSEWKNWGFEINWLETLPKFRQSFPYNTNKRKICKLI